jgi:hypothetical protein
MPSVRQPASAPRDRAERHVFGVLPELPAVERRVLALLELCDATVAEAAADLGIAEAEVREAAFAARRALRRLRAPLAAGARCTRGEHLHSDRLDTALERTDRRWLEIHEARCPRCIEHAALLDEARTELHVTFAAPAEKQLPPAPPEPPALDAGEPARAQLRVVPQAAELAPPAPAPAPPAATAEPVQEIERPAEEAEPVAVVTRRSVSVSVPPAAKRAARIVAIVLAIAVLLAAAGYGLAQIGGSDHGAPWAQPHAPNVQPAPLSGQ